MTAEELRRKGTDPLIDHPTLSAQVLVLLEIAAQLAELNEALRKLAGRSIFEQAFGKQERL